MQENLQASEANSFMVKLHLIELKDYDDYDIQIKPNTSQSGECKVVVMCLMCNNRQLLGVDEDREIKTSN